jgi:hypothetical protein
MKAATGHKRTCLPHRSMSAYRRIVLQNSAIVASGKAAFDAVDHCLGDGNFGGTVSARAFRIDDDPGLVVDEIVCVVSKERIGALPCDPCRLWIGQRHFFRSAASTAATARTAVISDATLLFFTAGGVEDGEILANRTGCLLGLRPGDRLIAGQPLLLGRVCPDQARIDRKPFAANQPSRRCGCASPRRLRSRARAFGQALRARSARCPAEGGSPCGALAEPLPAFGAILREPEGGGPRETSVSHEPPPKKSAAVRVGKYIHIARANP